MIMVRTAIITYDDNYYDYDDIIIYITMKLYARTAWGDGVSQYAARHSLYAQLLSFSLSVGKYCGRILKACLGFPHCVFYGFLNGLPEWTH